MSDGQPMKWHEIEPKPKPGDVLVTLNGTRELVGDVNADGGRCDCCSYNDTVATVELAPKPGRVAALEAHAAAFADAEWEADDTGWRNYAWCAKCGGIRPDCFDAMGAPRQQHEHRGHRPDCARGRAVAALKETT